MCGPHLFLGHVDTQFLHFLTEELFLDKFLPHQLFDGIAAIAIALQVLFFGIDSGAEIVVGHLSTVNLGKSLLAIVLAQVANNEANDSNTHHEHSYPRMFSNTSNYSHFVV